MKTLIRLYRASAVLFVMACCARAGVREAVDYLNKEVPRWKRENGCFSCHNNGDGVRALLAARRAGFEVNVDRIGEPGDWEQKTLAAVSYAAASPGPAAADWLVRVQEKDGHWRVDEEKMVGSPVTYGPVLATALARDTLQKAGRHVEAAQRAAEWLAANQSSHLIDIAARLMALGRKADAKVLLEQQASNGSWGGEAFDTAVAILALARHNPEAANRGRQYLLRTQLTGGGWAATTRPGGGDSYAQHISTTAWALLALLPATEELKK